MIDRTSKVTLAVGLAAAFCAVVLAVFSGTHFHWNVGAGGTHIDIRVGANNGLVTKLLGAIGIICLLLGTAFLALQSQGNGAIGEFDKVNSSFVKFLQALTLSKSDSWIGGVCGGLGAHTPLPSWTYRVLFLLLALCFGTGVLAYIILWICIPADKTLPT